MRLVSWVGASKRRRFSMRRELTLSFTLMVVVGLAVSSMLFFVAEGRAAANANPLVEMQTSMGTIKIELDAEKAPISTKNFMSYVDEGFYDGTIFHRVIRTFMVQGGGFEPGMKEKKKTKPPIKNEAGNGLKNKRGTLAMARTGVVDSATAQFFINVVDNAFLDHKDDSPRGYGYAVFGKVIEGMEVVDKIKAVETASKRGHDDVPVEDVVIQYVRRAK